MKKITQEQFNSILDLHDKWLRALPGGKRADLSYTNLSEINMAGANMAGANMAGANMAGAYMAEEYGKLITKRPILQINNIGRDNSCLSATFCEKGIVIRRGCFYGSLEEFEKQVDEVHGDSIHGKEYKAAIAFIKLHKDLWSGQDTTSESEAAKGV